VVLIVATVLGDGSPDVRNGATGLPDLLGIASGTAAVALLALGITKGTSWGWTSTGIVASLAGAVLLFPLFLWRSRRHPRPLVPLELFGIRRSEWRPSPTCSSGRAVRRRGWSGPCCSPTCGAGSRC
jgi:hypothetical protein